MDYEKRAREILDLEIQGLQKVREQLGDAFTRAVELILDCLSKNGKIVVSGIGKNWHIAQKVSATFASTGATSVALNSTQAMHGDLGVLCKGDVLLIFSYSGESEELLALLPLVKRSGVSVVAITGDINSTLGRNSHVTIPAAIEREACPFNMAPTVSTTAALAVGDALAMVLIEARGFRKDDYAKLHPGGAIGRALLMRAADIMRPEDRVARVQSGARVKEALVSMTRARAGSACVVDANGKLLGIFTDGDLRRHISENANLLETPVDEAMTPSPVTARIDQLAVDVLNLFERHNIEDLPVVDAAGKLAGAIDLQDLPKLKIL